MDMQQADMFRNASGMSTYHEMPPSPSGAIVVMIMCNPWTSDMFRNASAKSTPWVAHLGVYTVYYCSFL